MSEPRTYDVCGVQIAAVTPTGAAEQIIDAAAARERLEVHLCNAFTLSLVGRDERLRRSLLGAGLNLPDGTPVAWLGRRHGTTGPVRGPSLVMDVVRAGAPRQIAHYLYGGAPGVAEEMADALRTKVPGVRVAGVESPPYEPIDTDGLDALAHRIEESGSDIVWVGLGTPKQDYVVPQLAQRLSIPVVPVGAAFDFIAGRVAEAPARLHGSGFEWVYRLYRDPRRLWRRYAVGNPRFVRDVLRSRVAPVTRRLNHTRIDGMAEGGRYDTV